MTTVVFIQTIQGEILWFLLSRYLYEQVIINIIKKKFIQVYENCALYMFLNDKFIKPHLLW